MRSRRGRAVLLAALALAVAVILPAGLAAATSAPSEGLTGRILYTCPTQSGNPTSSAICGMNPDGTGAAPVVDGIDFCCFEFSLSPDGSSLSWVGGEPTQDLTVADADGSNRRFLPVGGTITSPVWSPQGDRIAFVATAFQTGRTEIDVVDADLTNLRTVLADPRIAHPGASGPLGGLAWSPDGTRLAFGTAVGGGPVPAGGIDVVPASGGTPARLVGTVPGGVTAVSWAPAAALLFTDAHEPGIREADATTGAVATVLSCGTCLDSSPSWGPDGSHFSAIRGGRVVIADPNRGVVQGPMGPTGIVEAAWGGGLVSAPGPGAGRNAFTQSVLTPGQIGLTFTHIATNVLLALALVLVVAFVTEIFNSTFAANYDRITRPFAGGRRRFERWAARARRRPVPAFAGTILVVSVLYCFLDPSFGFNLPSVALFLGMLGGLVVVTLTFDLVAVWHLRRRRRGWPPFRPYLAGIPIAVACVVMSRAAHFLPGYVLGAIAGFTFAMTLTRAEEGRLAAMSAAWMLALSLVAWVARTPVVNAEAHGAALGLQILDSTLTAVVVAGVEGVAFGLIPIRFLEGENVLAWSRRWWFGIFGAGVLAFVFLLLDPTGSYVGKTSVGPVWSMVVLVGGFTVATAGLWLWFRLRPRAPGEPPAWGPGPESTAVEAER